MAQRARTRQSLDGQVRDLLTGDRDAAEAAAEEIDGLGALGRDVPVCAVVLDLDAPGDPPPLNLWRLPRAVVAVATGTDVVLLVPAGLDVLAVAREARLLYTERLDPALHDAVVAGVGAVRPDLRRPAAARARPASPPGSPTSCRGCVRWPHGRISASIACSRAGRGGRCGTGPIDPAVDPCSRGLTSRPPRRRTWTALATRRARPRSWGSTGRRCTTGWGGSGS